MRLTAIQCDDCKVVGAESDTLPAHRLRHHLKYQGWEQWSRDRKQKDASGPVDLCPACSEKKK